MKKYVKPFVAPVSGLILISGLICQPAHALLNESGVSILADAYGSTSAPEALTVDWSVVENASLVYTYSYTVSNSVGDVVLVGKNTGKPEIFDVFSVAFNSDILGAVLPGSATGSDEADVGDGVTWNFYENVNAGSTSGLLTFQSDFAPVMGDATASDANPPSPWASDPNGQEVPIPNVPDSANTMAMLAGMMLLLPLGSVLKKKAS